MERKEIFNELKKIIAAHSEWGSSKEDFELEENSKIVEDAGFDSLDTIELMTAVEKRFKIYIPDEKAEKIETVKDLVDLVESSL